MVFVSFPWLKHLGGWEDTWPESCEELVYERAMCGVFSSRQKASVLSACLTPSQGHWSLWLSRLEELLPGIVSVDIAGA